MSRKPKHPNKYIVWGEITTITVVYKGEKFTAKIDTDDVDIAQPIHWCIAGRGYLRGWDKGRMEKVFLHTLLTGYEITDHENRKKLDNRRCNLRESTNSLNHANVDKKKGCSSKKYKGVYWDKERKKWRARIMVQGKGIHLGRFDNEIEAAIAYNIAARKYFGEFARINEIPTK